MGLPLDVEVLERQYAAPYNQLFKDCPHALAQQSLQWADVIAPLSPDKPYFLVVRGKDEAAVLGGLPLYYFEGKYGGILTSVPHAGPLGGVLCRTDMDDELRRETYGALTRKAIQIAEKLRCISLSIITNPFLDDAEFYKYEAQPHYVLNNFCQAMDLFSLIDPSGSYKTGRSSHNNKIRNNLAKAKKADVYVHWAGESDFEPWYEIHCKRHQELGAAPLPKPLLNGIISIMKPEGAGGLAIARIDERIVGGCFYIWNRNVADAFIISSDSDYFDCGINYAVTDFAVRYFHDKEIRWFNWQSCKRNSSVYAFKEQWGSQELNYQFLTWTFSGFQRVLLEDIDKVSKVYPGHYVAPFEAIKKKVVNGTFEKV